MKTQIIILLMLFSIISSFTCNSSISFYVQNNSSQPVYFEVSVAYPDTTIITVNRPPEGNYVPAGVTGTDIRGDISFGLTDTLQYFIFDALTIKTEAWDSIKAENKFLKRYVVSRQDLQSNKWTITYP